MFYKYKWHKPNGNWVLRLYLRRTGGFYGWNSYYNGNGQLVLSFLNPPTLIKANNKYGFSLKGQTIWVDAGHGGTDSGTYAYSGGKSEKYYTLLWAKELATSLTNLGAKVIMTRTSDKTVSLSTRYTRIQASGADFGISLHFDGSNSSSASGFFTGYFQPSTLKPAKSIANAIRNKNYLKTSRTGGVDFHYFNLSRTCTCPFVLTENGFLTSKSDFKKISDPAFRKKYIGAITDGIMGYFKSVSYKITDPVPKFTVEGCVTKTFNNAEQTQDLTVKYNGKVLKNGTDYTITYKNNKWVGNATATVKLKGKYKGTKNLNFTIKPAPWGIEMLTLDKNNVTVTWKPRTRQTSGFQILYSDTPAFTNAKTITVSGADHTSYVIKNLARNKTYYVRLRTYKYSGGVKYNSAYSKIKSITVKK